MKRADAFMLGMTAFLAANCISYFVISDAPCVVLRWRPRWSEILEAVGFPFVVFSVEETRMSSSWLACLGNLAVAACGSYLFAKHFAHRLPPLWAGYCRTFRYSLRGLGIVTAVVCCLLGVAMAGFGWGLTVRNLTCFGGPAAIYAWYLYRQSVGWAWLVAATVGLALLALLIDCRYGPFINGIVEDWTNGSAWYYRRLYFLGLVIIRAVVPICGLTSLFVMIHAACDVIRIRQALK